VHSWARGNATAYFRQEGQGVGREVERSVKCASEASELIVTSPLKRNYSSSSSTNAKLRSGPVDKLTFRPLTPGVGVGRGGGASRER